MTRIGVTQRVDVVASYVERRDCLDQQWGTLLEAAQFDMVPIPNGLRDVAAWANRQRLKGLLLSGGNDLAHLPGAMNIAPERDKTEAALLQWARQQQIPVLAVCRGMQMLNCWLGGGLHHLDGHVACRHPIRVAEPGRLSEYHGVTVNSFHAWGIDAQELAQDLTSLAWSDDGDVEAFQHSRLPWTGIMWHPERETPMAARDVRLIRTVFFKPDA